MLTLRRTFKSWALGPVLLSAWILSGCGTVDVHVLKPVESGNSFPRTVAILPFTINEEAAEEKQPHKILREVFYNYFVYLGFTDIPLGEVDTKLRQSNITIKSAEDELDYKLLEKILGADAVVRGNVLEAVNFTGGIHAETSITARLEMIDLRDSELLWEVDHQEISYSGIASPALIDLIKDQIDNTKVVEAYYKVAESFSQQVVKKLPDPSGLRENEIHLPRITSIETNLKTQKSLKPSDRIYVSLRGQPGLAASFDIGSWRTSIPMKEVAPGHYTGSYQIQEGDEVTNALIIGSLKNPKGLSSKKYYKAAMATIEKTTNQ